MALMNQVWEKEIDKFVLVCPDDILIYRQTWKDHSKHVQKVTIKLDLSELMKSKVFLDVFRDRLLKPFVPDPYSRYTDPQSNIILHTFSKTFRLQGSDLVITILS